MEELQGLLPPLVVGVAAVLGLMLAQRILERASKSVDHSFRNQVIMISLTVAAALLFILVLPMGDALRGQLLGLLGIVASAAIALSSTTILGNAMAGIMLRAVKAFRIGDFIRSGDFFGRVSERGLFHTEIQTEDRDLTTLPNMFLVTHPVTTMRSSGTIVSGSVSLGYDLSRSRVKKLLLEAAETAGLTDPFVQIKELGDFSVTYRVAGLLEEVKQLISTRSRLKGCMMDALHHGGVEIVSPAFMNQRVYPEKTAFIPRREGKPEGQDQARGAEEIAFDKAEEAETLEALRLSHARLGDELKAAEELVKDAGTDAARSQAEKEVERLTRRRERLEKVIAARSERAELRK